MQLRKRQQVETNPFSSRRDRAGTTATLPPLPDGSSGRPRQFGGKIELADDLDGMAASLGEVDPRASERLAELARSIDTEEGRQRWGDVDLRRAFNTERLAHAYAVRREGGYAPPSVDRADKIRNVMVLLPIFLTWAALAEASRAYQRYIADNPDEVRQPFLLLWQNGFGGESNWYSMTFSTVAILDAIIIFVIITLTFYSHGRREQHEDAINATAGTFQTELDNVLAEATVALGADRASRPAMLARSVERLAERFDMSSQELLTRLRVEHDRLEAIATRREKEFADFGVFASGMRAGAEETHRLLIDLRQVSSGLQSALEDLTSEVSVAGDQQRSLLTAVNSLERLTSTGIQSDHAVTRQLAEAANSLADAADRAIAGADTAAQAGRVSSEAVRSIAEISATLASSMARVEHAIADEAEANSRLADSLRGGLNGVGTAAKTLSDISGGLVHLRDEFTRLGELSADQSMTLSRLLTEQSAIASDLSRVARDLSAAGITSLQRQSKVHDDASELLKRLDNLTNALARATSGMPTPEALQQTVAGAVRSELSGQPDRYVDPYETATEVAPGLRRDRGLWPRRDER